MKPLKIYVGWDGRDADAYRVCAHSLRKHASIPVEIVALKEWEVRATGAYFRSYHVDERGQSWDDRDGKPFSTAFSFTRFAVPLLAAAEPLVLFCDPDMLWRADIADLVEAARQQPDKAVICVHHSHVPIESSKMTGLMQTRYARKNWSSLMLLRPRLCDGLTRFQLNNATGASLHALTWVREEQIGELPVEWNWLEGWSSEEIDPKVVHFTRGTPDMPGYENACFADEWRQALDEIEGKTPAMAAAAAS